jgi:hypothetical protein
MATGPRAVVREPVAAQTGGCAYHIVHIVQRLFKSGIVGYGLQKLVAAMSDSGDVVGVVFDWVDQTQVAQAHVAHGSHNTADIDGIAWAVENDHNIFKHNRCGLFFLLDLYNIASIVTRVTRRPVLSSCTLSMLRELWHLLPKLS